MKSFEPNLYCLDHNKKIDVYCQNPECKIETRICCYICAEKYHNHKTTRICELQNVFNETIIWLSDKHELLEQFVQQFNGKVQAISKQIEKIISTLKSIIENSEDQKLTNLINGLMISTSKQILKISDEVTQLIEKQPHICQTMSQQTKNYVQLLKENKKEEAKQVLQEIIILNENNEIYKLELNRLKDEIFQDSRPQNQQENTPDIKHLILQYQCFLEEDKNENEALKVLDQILEIEQGNYIYQRERSRLTHEFAEYSIADDRFLQGQYLASALECDKLLQIRQDARIYYQRGLSLFYIKNYEQALNSIEQSIKIDNENIQYQITKSQLLFAKKDYENLKIQAMDLKKIFESINLVIQGQQLMLQKQYEEAKGCFELAIQTNYFQFEAFFFKAECLSKIKSTDELPITQEQALQNILIQQPQDITRFNKFYNMYSEKNNQQNNQFQLTENLLQNLMIQQMNKQATTKSPQKK